MISGEQIEKYLAELPWKSAPFEGSDSWLVILTNEAGQFNLTIEIQNEWLAFVINPLVENVVPKAIARLSYHLCRLNQDSVLVKYSLDDETDVAVAVELMRQGVEDVNFYQAINMLNFYIEKQFKEIVRLSQDHKAPSQYLADPGEDE